MALKASDNFKVYQNENGKAYAYRDSAGNYYEMNFGLSY